MAESSSISARKYSSSSRRKTSRSLCGLLWLVAGLCAWTAKAGGEIIRLRSMAEMAPVLMPAGPFMLLLDFNSAPKGHVVLDVAGCRLRIRVIPGGILIFLSVYQQAVVSGLSLPGTGRNRRAGTKIFPLERALR